MKKIISTMLCALILISCAVFSANAQSANFRFRVSSVTDNEITAVFEITSGTGFCALDVSIDYDNVKYTLTDAGFAEQFSSYQMELIKSGAGAISSLNKKDNPVKASIAVTKAYSAGSGKGEIIILKFSKIPGTKTESSDFSVNIETCQNAQSVDITPSVAYDLYESSPAGSGKTDSSKTKSSSSSDENGTDPDGEKKSSEDESSTSASSPQADNSTTGTSPQGDRGGSGAESSSVSSQSAKKRNVIIIVSAIVGAAAIAAAAVVIIKNARKDEDLNIRR